MAVLTVKLVTTQAETPKPRWWHWVFLVVTVGGVGAAVYFGGRAIVHTFQHLDKEVAAALVTAGAAVVVTVSSAVLARYFDRRQAREQAERTARIPVYEDFVKGLLDLLGIGKAEEERRTIDEADARKMMAAFTEKIIIWGSDDVIRAWVDWRYAAAALGDRKQTDAEAIESMLHLESLLLTFRKDLGLRNKGLRRGDILRLWINDLVIPAGGSGSSQANETANEPNRT